MIFAALLVEINTCRNIEIPIWHMIHPKNTRSIREKLVFRKKEFCIIKYPKA